MNKEKVIKYLKYGLYILPLYGTIKEFRKPKEERNKMGIVGWSIYSIPFVIKVGLGIGFIFSQFGNKNINESNYQNKERDSLEINQKINKENKLEKTIYYENILK